MSTLNEMNNKSNLIDDKLKLLMNFAFLNLLDNSLESKIVLSVHIQDILGSEESLLKIYKDYIDKNINTADVGKKKLTHKV